MSFPRHSRLTFLQKLTDASYSELFLVWIVINTGFAAVYFALSYTHPLDAPTFPISVSLTERVFDSLYFSIITATTVGFGDIVPLGISKLLVSLQSTSAFLVFAVLVGKLVSQRQDLALHEVHRMTFEGIFYQIRGGLFTVRKDFDMLIEKADARTSFDHNDWHRLSSAYLHAQNIIEQIPDLYTGLGSALHSIDLKRERLLFEGIHRTLARLNTLLEHFNDAEIDWIHHLESTRELQGLINSIEIIMPLWKLRSPFHEVQEFEEIRSLAEILHTEMKSKMGKEG